MHHTFGTFLCCPFTTATWNFLIYDFLFLFQSLDESLRIHLQKHSQPTDKRLEKRELIFYATFSSPSPSSLLKLPIFNQRRRKKSTPCAKGVWLIPVQSQGKIAVQAWSLILEVLILCCCFLPSLGMPVVSNQTPGDKLLALTFYYDYSKNLVQRSPL